MARSVLTTTELWRARSFETAFWDSQTARQARKSLVCLASSPWRIVPSFKLQSCSADHQRR